MRSSQEVIKPFRSFMCFRIMQRLGTPKQATLKSFFTPKNSISKASDPTDHGAHTSLEIRSGDKRKLNDSENENASKQSLTAHSNTVNASQPFKVARLTNGKLKVAHALFCSFHFVLY